MTAYGSGQTPRFAQRALVLRYTLILGFARFVSRDA